MSDLTAAQQAVLEAIRQLAAEHGSAPSVSRLAQRLGYASKGTVAKHLVALRAKGLLQVDVALPTGSHTVLADGLVTLPVVGRVAAGVPIAEGERERELTVSADLFRLKPAYLLHVSGDSMVDAGILDGDLIGVYPTPTADSGRIVVARLGESLTVKRLRHNADGVRLESCNANYPTIRPAPDEEFAIEGLFCGLVRVV